MKPGTQTIKYFNLEWYLLTPGRATVEDVIALCRYYGRHLDKKNGREAGVGTNWRLPTVEEMKRNPLRIFELDGHWPHTFWCYDPSYMMGVRREDLRAWDLEAGALNPLGMERAHLPMLAFVRTRPKGEWEGEGA